MLNASINIPPNREAIEALLEGFVLLDGVVLRMLAQRGKRVPMLYASRIVYRNEPPGRDDWARVDEVIKQGWGDCEDLVGWRVAELRFHGEPARAIAVPTRTGKWHALVERGNGTIEDPSRALIRAEKRRKAKR